MKLPTDYDRTCIHISAKESDEREAGGEVHVIRLKVGSPLSGLSSDF